MRRIIFLCLLAAVSGAWTVCQAENVPTTENDLTADTIPLHRYIGDDSGSSTVDPVDPNQVVVTLNDNHHNLHDRSAEKVRADSIASLVPAMIVQRTDGTRQVIRLEATDVTELMVMQTGGALTVDIPESHLRGVRSITFAMVDKADLTAIENNQQSAIFCQKVLRDGQVLIRLQMPDGTIIEYDMHGNIITNK
jgi:hypothetical protein